MKPHHPMACIFPMLGRDDLTDLAESIQRSGQREPIVIFEGKILDGRNTAAACEQIGIQPIYREYDRDTDGESPIRFVLDRNLERRHLTPSQKAAAATAALAFIDKAAAKAAADGAPAAPASKAKPDNVVAMPAPRPTAKELAESAQVSERTMQDALTVAKVEGPEGLQPVIDGKVSVSEAATAARAKKKTAAKEYPPKPDEKLNALRAEHEGKMKKIHGDNFARSFANGTILTTKADITEFLDLEPEAQKDIVEYIAQGWSVKKAIKFHNRDIALEDKISELILRANSAKNQKFACVVAGYQITIQPAK